MISARLKTLRRIQFTFRIRRKPLLKIRRLCTMFVLISILGSRERKVQASYTFFLYTLFGSVLMLLSILFISCSRGTTDYEIFLTYTFTFKNAVFCIRVYNF
jgi:NADH:ubiquinone oxidoreductase subunit 4 (subunit M)